METLCPLTFSPEKTNKNSKSPLNHTKITYEDRLEMSFVAAET